MKMQIWESKNKDSVTLVQEDSPEHEYLTKNQVLKKEFEVETIDEARKVFKEWRER